jgi:hypothetical protein
MDVEDKIDKQDKGIRTEEREDDVRCISLGQERTNHIYSCYSIGDGNDV